MLYYNSKMKLLAGKLRSKWEGPFTIVNVFPHGLIEIKWPNSEQTFKVIGHQLKIIQETQPMGEDDDKLILQDLVIEE